MKLLKRNCTEFEYLPYTGLETDLNEDGDHTGEYRRVYGEPVPYMGSISAPSGQVTPAFYGDDIRYTHTLIMDQPNADIHESGLIRWKGNIYEIKAVRPSLNVLNVALKQRTKEHEDPYIPDNTDGDGT